MSFFSLCMVTFCFSVDVWRETCKKNLNILCSPIQICEVWSVRLIPMGCIGVPQEAWVLNFSPFRLSASYNLVLCKPGNRHPVWRVSPLLHPLKQLIHLKCNASWLLLLQQITNSLEPENSNGFKHKKLSILQDARMFLGSQEPQSICIANRIAHVICLLKNNKDRDLICLHEPTFLRNDSVCYFTVTTSNLLKRENIPE